jgi:hypothetical protein
VRITAKAINPYEVLIEVAIGAPVADWLIVANTLKAAAAASPPGAIVEPLYRFHEAITGAVEHMRHLYVEGVDFKVGKDEDGK